MTEEQKDIPEAVSEQQDVGPQEQEEPKMVPLAALQAERRKRQEAETRNRVYDELMNKNAPQEDDSEALLTKGKFQEEKALTKREIMEQMYEDLNPKAVQKINKYLQPILDKKPWLISSIDASTNRLARANEIVDDYMHLVEEKPKKHLADDAKRIVENSKKPGSPADVGKSAQASGAEYMKSIQGKKEFREYRKNLLSGN